MSMILNAVYVDEPLAMCELFSAYFSTVYAPVYWDVGGAEAFLTAVGYEN